MIPWERVWISHRRERRRTVAIVSSYITGARDREIERERETERETDREGEREREREREREKERETDREAGIDRETDRQREREWKIEIAYRGRQTEIERHFTERVIRESKKEATMYFFFLYKKTTNDKADIFMPCISSMKLVSFPRMLSMWPSHYVKRSFSDSSYLLRHCTRLVSFGKI